MTDSKEINLNYPLLVWMSTLIVSPLLWIFYSEIKNGGDVFSFLKSLPAFYTLGLMFSLPTFGLFALVYIYISKKTLSDIVGKVILFLVVILGITLTFYIIGGDVVEELALFYSISAAMAIIIFKVKLTTP
jgi:hypothetical protein